MVSSSIPPPDKNPASVSPFCTPFEIPPSANDLAVVSDPKCDADLGVVMITLLVIVVV